MNTGWNSMRDPKALSAIINLLGNEYWLELFAQLQKSHQDYKPTGK